MQPPAAGPLIHGSTTPIANEVAIAASTASPPAASTFAPASAARRCCAATTPPRVGTTGLRTTCVSEKLSIIDAPCASCGGVRACVGRDLGVRREPYAVVSADVADELVEDPDARAIAADVRMQRELEQAVLAVRRVELAAEDVEHVARRRIRPQTREAVHVEVDGVVADPLDRKLDHAGRLAVHQE